MTYREFYQNKLVWIVIITAGLLLTTIPNVLFAQEDTAEAEEPAPPSLLTDPFLQLPTADGVHVVWFTEWEGSDHTVTFGADLENNASAATTKLSRTAEDAKSRVGDQVEDGQVYATLTARDIWRHEALVTGLTAGTRVPYYVTSITAEGEEVQSEEFTLQPLPETGQPLKILLTSDHQLFDEFSIGK